MMNARVSVVLYGMACVLLWPHVARGQETPGDRVVTYYIREEASQPESDTVFRMELTLEAQYVTGDSVGWAISQIRLIDLGTPVMIWTDSSPDLDTSDGLWWVEHEDILDPQASEFGVPPHLVGTAAPGSGPFTALDYDCEGVECDSECLELFGGDVGALSYQFTESGEQAPLLADNGPVAIADDPFEPDA